jgi:hypothetical protein
MRFESNDRRDVAEIFQACEKVLEVDRPLPHGEVLVPQPVIVVQMHLAQMPAQDVEPL